MVRAIRCGAQSTGTHTDAGAARDAAILVHNLLKPDVRTDTLTKVRQRRHHSSHAFLGPFSRISHAFLSAMPRHTRREMCPA